MAYLTLYNPWHGSQKKQYDECHHFTYLLHKSWLDRGVLINVDALGCGTSVVRGPTGHK